MEGEFVRHIMVDRFNKILDPGIFHEVFDTIISYTDVFNVYNKVFYYVHMKYRYGTSN